MGQGLLLSYATNAWQLSRIFSAKGKSERVAQAGAATCSFTYDASGNRVSDGAGSSVLNEQYDGHGHLLSVLNGAATDGAYGYDAFSRLVQRVVANVSPSGTTQYLYDEFGHVILETDGAGNSLREYIWLDDMPIGIIDQVNTASPVLYYVHADHLDRPIRVEQSVWAAVWTPFGAPLSITGPLTLNARFPGQWFQIESGLNWNWNRHYDPSTGRYVQPDPFSTQMRDQTQAGALAGVPTSMGFAANLVHGFNDAVARSGVGQINDVVGGQPLPAAPAAAADLLEQLSDPTKGGVLPNAVFPDGPSRYGYARQAPLTKTDQPGLASGPFTPRPEASDIRQCFVPGGGGGGGFEKCPLMPGIEQYGFCLYICPGGGALRLDLSRLGCQGFLFSHQGLGPDQ